VVAALIAKRTKARFVVWVQDSMTAAAEQSGISGGTWAAKLLRPVESWVLRRASSIAVVSDSFREHAESFGVQAESIATIRNWAHVSTPQADREAVRADMGWVNRMVVLHAGNMGLKQGLERVVSAARSALDAHPEMLFVLMGDGSQRDVLQEAASGLTNLVVMDPVANEDFMDTLAAADVLLVCESASVVDMSLPSKLTSYMASGRPILGAVRPDGATARELEFSGAGLVVDGDDDSALLLSLTDLICDRERMTLIGEKGQKYAASDLSPDSALAKLSELVTAS
jgi:glycosyltransferase involved in cell wall biosynthesis